MFSNESIRNYVNKIYSSMREHEKEYAKNPGITYHDISISKGNSKIGKVHNVSLAPIITCGNCSHCSGFCYDVKAGRYKNVIDARARNTVIAMEYRESFFAGINEYLNHPRKHKYFRWHVGGEIIDYSYFESMIEIAKNHPDWFFWTYTKMHHIVNEYCDVNGRDAIPENFVIMFSEWDGMPLVNPYNFPIFTCKMKDGNKNHPVEFFNTLYKCPGNCDICKKAKRGCMAGESTYADEH